MDLTAREIHLRQRPHGEPTLDDFAFVEHTLAEPGEGELLVRNHWLSVDPYMRGRMSDRKSYIAPFEVGAVMEGGAVGEVVASGDERFAPGDRVLHGSGWRDLALIPARRAQKVDATRVPEQAFLGVLGMPGLTAYAGLVEVAPVRDGDVVLISSAAGAVGSAAAQLARLLGAARVIGIAGGPAKTGYVIEELGCEGAIDYKQAPVRQQLRAIAPDGIDVFFDNVGGEQLEAAIGSLRVHGRIAVCGAISIYNATEATPGPRNLDRLIQTRGQIRGMLVGDHTHLRDRFLAQVGGWMASGALRYRETIVDGFESAPQAFIELLNGANIGKMLVRV